MKKSAILIFMAFFLMGGAAGGASAADETRYRLGGGMGYFARGYDINDPDSSTQNTSQWGVALGFIPSPNLEWGVEVSQIEMAWEDRVGTVSEMSDLLVSPYVLFVLSTDKVRFPFGGGLEVGSRRNQVLGTTVGGDVSGTFWTVGCRYHLSADVSLDLSVRVAKGGVDLMGGEAKYKRVDLILGASFYL